MQAATEKLLKEAWDSLNTSMVALENGGNVDLSAFDEKARAFCESLKDLPPEQAKKYENSISEFIVRINFIKDKVEFHRDTLEDQINSLNKRNVAYNAYGNAIILAAQSIKSEE